MSYSSVCVPCLFMLHCMSLEGPHGEIVLFQLCCVKSRSNPGAESPLGRGGRGHQYNLEIQYISPEIPY